MSSSSKTERGCFQKFLPNVDVTNKITYIILGAYVILVSAFVAIAFVLQWVNGTDQKDWFDLAKTGFTTIGSALTLILGYYFGKNQAGEEVRKEAENKVEAIEDSRSALARQFQALETPPQPDSPPKGRAVQRGSPPGRPGSQTPKLSTL